MGILSSVSNETKNQLGKLYAIDGWTAEKCSKWLEETIGILVSADAVYNQLRRWGFKRHKETVSPKIDVSVEETVEKDRKKLGYEAEIKYWKSLYYASAKQSAQIEQVLDVAKNVLQAIPSIPVLYKMKNIDVESAQVAVSPLCDTHIGERVDLDQMSGLNKYDMDIFNKRMFGWANQVVKLVSLRQKYAQINRLVIPLLGDMVSGEIHLELVKTNVDNAMGQMIRGASIISQAIVFMSQYFQEIYVPCVVGNHGRMAIKPPAKDMYMNWDYLMYQFISAYCVNQKNIKFSIPKSFFYVIEVAGKKILLMHGDGIKGGFAGIPYYGMSRTVAQLRQTLQFRKGLEDELQKLEAEYFDGVMIGHFHTSTELDIGTGPMFVCGCMKGGDEYSLSKLHTLSKPTQLLTYWHPKYGYISKDVIYLQKYDKSDEKFVDALPEVWIEK